MAGSGEMKNAFDLRGRREQDFYTSNMDYDQVPKSKSPVTIPISAYPGGEVIQNGGILFRSQYSQYPDAIIVNTDGPVKNQRIVVNRSIERYEDFGCIVIGKDGKVRRGQPAEMGQYATAAMEGLAFQEDLTGEYQLAGAIGALVVPMSVKLDIMAQHTTELESMIAQGTPLQSAFLTLLDHYYPTETPCITYAVQEKSYLELAQGFLRGKERIRQTLAKK